MAKNRSKGKGNKLRRRRANDDKASIDARNQNDQQELDTVQQLANNLSLEDKDNSEECNCDHGIPKRIEARLPIRLFMLRFERNFQATVEDPEPKPPQWYYFGMAMFIIDACKGAELSAIQLRADEMEKMSDRFISIGTDYLLKHERGNGNVKEFQNLAASLAILAYIISKYTPGDDRNLESYIRMRVFENKSKVKDDYLDLLKKDFREVAQFFSSRIHCSCIPKRLLCWHGFQHPPSGDTFYLFKEQYQRALEQVMESCNTNYASIHVYATRKLEELGLSHLWDSEEKMQRLLDYFVSLGTDCVLAENWLGAGVAAIAAKSLEMNKTLNPLWEPDENESGHGMLMSSPAMCRFFVDLSGDPQREMTKFFSSRNGCSCLKGQYKSLKKKGICNHCCKMKDWRELKMCNACKTVNYCSKLCQQDDWLRHKVLCKTIQGASEIER